MTDRAEMEGAFEALLFVAEEPILRHDFAALFPQADAEERDRALDSVLERYRDAEARGVMLDEVSGGYRLVTRPELHGYLASYFKASHRSRISMAALETLAIVAYRQPITAPEIQELRGVGSTSVLRTLLDLRLIRIAGRKEVVGRPFLYRTTREFLLRFGLNRLRDLPPLEEFEELLAQESEDDQERRPSSEQLDLAQQVTDGSDPDEDLADDPPAPLSLV